MKKLLIFLMLFAFGFGAYCAETLVYDSGVLSYAVYNDVYIIPATGDYRFVLDGEVVSGTTTEGWILQVQNFDASDGVLVFPDSHMEFTKTVTVGTGIDFYVCYWLGNYTCQGSLKIYQLDVPEPPVITSSTSLNKIAGQSFSYTITATGDPTISYGASNLPTGFTLSGSTISGTVPASNFSFNITATNSAGSDNETVNVTVTTGIASVITSSLSVNADAGQSFAYSITASGTPSITYNASNLPSFLSFNGSTVSGTIPTGQTVDFSFDISATNFYGSDSETVTVHAIAGQPPVITSPVTVSATSGQSFSYSVTATGYSPITYSASGLPAYLSFNGSTVSGTLPVSLLPVSFSFTVGASNVFGSDSKVVTVNATAGNTGQFDSDDDVPAINAMKEAVIASLTAIKTDTFNIAQGWSQWGILWAQFNANYMDPIRSNVVLIPTIIESLNSVDATLFDIHTSIMENGGYLVNFSDNFTTFSTASLAKLDELERALGEVETSIYQVSEYTGMIADDTIIIRDDVSIIKTNIDIIKTDSGIVKTNVIEINDKMTNIVDLITLINTNDSIQTAKLESIKGVLNQSLTVQQDQLTTQNSILELLDQIANPEPVQAPPMPIDSDIDEPASIDFNLDLTPDNEPLDRELKEYSKEFPVIDHSLRQRSGGLFFKITLPFSKISDSLDDKDINFGEGVLGQIVYLFRSIVACVLYYFTLLLWFRSVRRLTD